MRIDNWERTSARRELKCTMNRLNAACTERDIHGVEKKAYIYARPPHAKTTYTRLGGAERT